MNKRPLPIGYENFYEIISKGLYYIDKTLFIKDLLDFIRELFGSTLKTNECLEFAVVTGCLRISKESIFTGLNNIRINSVLTRDYGEYFGFTEKEAKKLCKDYGIAKKFTELQEWYNGYLFGDVAVYNPWSAIQYVYDHSRYPDEYPVSYWANTSSNIIVRDLIDRADRKVKDEIEILIAGGTIEKPIHEDITYQEIDKSMDNLWNFLFFTGYLKKVSQRFENRICYLTLEIPNQEVLYIYENKIREWFDEKLKSRNPQKLFNAIVEKDAKTIEDEIGNILADTISFHDYYENFYHGFLAGVLYGMSNYVVKSNRESGRGRTDLYLRPSSRKKTAYIFEFKVTKNITELEEKAKEALGQIYERKYDKELTMDGYRDIVRYGIAFFEKDCCVKVE